MPLITDSHIVQIEIDESPGEWYRLRTRLNWRELENCTSSDALKMKQRSLFNQSRRRPNGDGDDMMEITFDSLVLKMQKIETILESWSHPLPITSENIMKIDGATMDQLLDICDEIIDANKGGQWRPDFLSENWNTSSDKPQTIEMQPVNMSQATTPDS